MTLSLRTQLYSWFGLALVIIVFGVTFITQQVSVWNQQRTMDDSLQKRANTIAAIIASDITTDEASYAQVIEDLTKQELPFVPLLLRVLSPSGKIIIEFGEVSSAIDEKLDYQLGLPDIGKGRFDTILAEGADSLRAYTILVSNPRTNQILAYVQNVESLAQLEESQSLVWRNGIIVGLVGTLLALFVGIFIIRRGFRPLQKILETIDRADYTHLKLQLQKESRPAELEQLAQSLTAMWQRLDIAIDDKKRLLGGVSHDIRTPLTSLQGQLEVLLLQPSLNAETRQAIERMLKETQRLVRLLKDLLLNVQLESKPVLATEEVKLRELVDEVVGDMWALAKGLQVNVLAPRDVSTHGDRDLLKQMVVNIVDNAIKFTPKGGKIELTLTGEGEWAVLEISDTGQGIHSDDLPHVSEAFYRPTKSRRSASEGAGLGLSIVRQIVELHGGHLEIRSQEGFGTSVRVRLPKRVLIVLSESK